MIPALQTSVTWASGDPPRTTFDPNAMMAGVTLSTDKLTMTGAPAVNWSSAHATQYHTGGRWYYEWQGQGQVYAGLVTAASPLVAINYPGHDAYGLGVISDARQQSVAGTGHPYPDGALEDGGGHVFAMAVDLSAGWFCVKQLGGDWWGVAGIANPLTGVNCDPVPASFFSGGGAPVSVVPRAACNGAYTCRFAFGRPQILFDVPPGFLPWNGG